MNPGNRYTDTDDIDGLMSDLLSKSQVAPAKKKPSEQFFRRKRGKKKPTIFDSSTTTSTASLFDNRKYSDTIFGTTPPSRPKRHHHSKPRTTTIAIQIPAISIHPLKRKVRTHKKKLLIIAGIVLCSIVAVIAVNYIIKINNHPSVPDNVENVTPKNVIIPTNLPKDFAIGSGSEKLENGAVIYTLYDDKGRPIYVTQQAKTASFDGSILRGASKFITKTGGTGYTITTTDRTIGYLMTETTLILFNASPGVSASKLTELIRDFQ